MSKPPIGFIPEPITLGLDLILPTRKTPEGLHASRKFKQILSSIQDIGLIEPLSVSKPDEAGRHFLLDGHMRLQVLRQLGFDDAPCLVSTDDESYTYNNRINRISSIQEHHMLRRAVERGVSPERLAKALSVDISLIYKKVSLLEGVCPEAAEMLKDQHFSANLGSSLRRVKPTRQIECVDLMLAANNMTIAYADALIAATPPHLLVSGKRPRKMAGVTAEQMAKMEREMGNLQGQFKLVEQSYGQDVLLLVLLRGFLAKWIDNHAVFRFLSQRHPEFLAQYDSIVRTEGLEAK